MHTSAADQRPLTSDLLPQAVDLWNRALGENFPMRPALLSANLWGEPNFDQEGSRAVMQGDRMIGLIAVKRRQVDMGNQPADQKGWISALVVDPAVQGRGLGSALLQGALAHLRRFSAEPVSIGSDPSHFFPGIPYELRPALDWFTRRGVVPGSLACDLASFEITSYEHPAAAREAYAREPGVEYRPVAEWEQEALRAFMRREFPGRWAWEIDRHLEEKGNLEDVMVAVEGGQIIGFARIHGPWSSRFGPGIYWAPLFTGAHGGMGPIGVGAAQRGRGIGLGLLSAAIATLRDRGAASAVIDWTQLVQFYGMVGFRPWKWYITASVPAPRQ